MHSRGPEQLDDWVQQVLKTSFFELHHFVSGLRKTEMLSEPPLWSSGAMEWLGGR